MQSSHLDEVRIADLRPIDWYDDVVCGLARVSGRDGWLLVSLVAWNLDLQEKVFALVPVSAGRVDRISRLLTPDFESGSEECWQEIQQEVSLLRSECRGKVWLIKCRNFGEPLKGQIEIDIDELGLRDHIGQDVEAALQEVQVDQWFRLFEQSSVGRWS